MSFKAWGVCVVAAISLVFAYDHLTSSDELSVENSSTQSTYEPERIEEDDPRWDCETVGNGKCGDDAPLPEHLQNA